MPDGEPADLPIDNWETEGKGMVRIVKGGNALCGYSRQTAGEPRI